MLFSTHSQVGTVGQLILLLDHAVPVQCYKYWMETYVAGRQPEIVVPLNESDVPFSTHSQVGLLILLLDPAVPVQCYKYWTETYAAGRQTEIVPYHGQRPIFTRCVITIEKALL